jgi:hypothetical protein
VICFTFVRSRVLAELHATGGNADDEEQYDAAAARLQRSDNGKETGLENIKLIGANIERSRVLAELRATGGSVDDEDQYNAAAARLQRRDNMKHNNGLKTEWQKRIEEDPSELQSFADEIVTQCEAKIPSHQSAKTTGRLRSEFGITNLGMFLHNGMASGRAPAVMEAIRNNLEARGVKLFQYDRDQLATEYYNKHWSGWEVLAARMHAAGFTFATAPEVDERIPTADLDLWAARREYERLAGSKLRNGWVWMNADRLKVKIQEMEAAKAAQAPEEMLTGSDEGEQCGLEDATAIIDMRTANDAWQSNWDAWFARTQVEPQQRVAEIEAEQSAQAVGGWAQAVDSWESLKVVIGEYFMATPETPPNPAVAIQRSTKRRRLDRDTPSAGQLGVSDDEHEASGFADASNAYIDATTASAGHK